MLPFEFDFRNPDYPKVWKWRLDVLKIIRENPDVLDAFKDYYREKPGEFISHWGSTFDPRNADIGLPTVVPFILFERQEEWVEWTLAKWRNRENGLSEKSRDMGLSWLSVGLACTLCLFHNDISIGFGSRKEIYVDKIGDPKSLFYKARMFMERLPVEFKGGFDIKRDAPHMQLRFPATGSSIVGEGGDGIGRGDRKTIYFVDEAAHIMRPDLIEASLSNTTNCRIDISSAKGMGNPFAQKRFSLPPELVFTFHWREDPRKAPDFKIYKIPGKSGLHNWYDWISDKLNNPVVLAQEVDINYSASIEGVVIPGEWIQAAIDACGQLGIEPSGSKDGALDIADEGKDLNAFASKHGIQLTALQSWSGKGGDTLKTAERATALYDEHDCTQLQYDSDGIGAGIRSDFRIINERRKEQNAKAVAVVPFRGSGEVIQPERETIKGRKNKDYFANRKAQAWWMLRLRFQNTFRVITAHKNGEVYECNLDDIISIPSNLPQVTKLVMELSQPTYTINTAGKILIDKAPDGTKSPNLADAIMMLFSPRRSGGLFS